MLLEYVNNNTKTINAFKNKKIFTTTDLLRTFPRTYLDYREIVPLCNAVGKDTAICVKVLNVEKKTGKPCSMIKVKGQESSGTIINITWFGAAHLFSILVDYTDDELIFCGKVTHDEQYGYSMNSPKFFFRKNEFYGRIIPVYPKYKNISEKKFKETMDLCFSYASEPLTDSIIKEEHLLPYEEALQKIHHPKSLNDIEEAKKRFAFDDMMYFALKMNRNNDNDCEESPFIAKSFEITSKFIKSLPFEFSNDQKKVINDMYKSMRDGKRIDYLVQGDVGCGKSIVAFLMMILSAENHFQSALMAPTAVLARQHYEELNRYAKELGFKAVLLSSEISAKEKRAALKAIKNNEVDFIVGTHSVIADTVEYKNLGMVIVDEEHRFGVKQRDALAKKCKAGAHVISMSATPIPRTVTDIVYGQKTLANIKTMPKGRIPIQTAINNSTNKIFEFAEKQLSQGRQMYVVCPRINDETENARDLYSVEKAIEEYTSYFEPKGFKVGYINGKMKKDEISEILSGFTNNDIQILISTTVIEVGVNVPNANLIVINNAETFGLAQLHQLRGRVGRGSYKSYCILKSSDKQNPRLNIMVSTTDGFVISEEDLKLRGSGNLIGTEQSGWNYFTDLAITQPELFKKAKSLVGKVIDSGCAEEFIETYEEGKEAV